MSEILLIRHAQASFGAADYDKLSDLGHEQARALGQALKRQGAAPVRLVLGAQRRHRETLDGIAPALGLDPAAAQVHPGLNEFDFKGLLAARFRDGGAPEGMNADRRTHFRTLRDTVLAWQRDEIDAPPEAWQAFLTRVRAAREALATDGPVLAVSSGGPISLMIADLLEAPHAHQMNLQLQMKNCAVSRLIVGRGTIYLAGFNETPHITAETDHLLSHS